MRVAVRGGDADRRATIVHALVAAGIELVEEGRHDTLLTIAATPTTDGTLQLGRAHVDLAQGLFRVDGREWRLTRLEQALLLALRAAGPAGLDRRALIARVWRLSFDPGTNIVAVQVARLRARLGADAIQSADGRYRLGNAEPAGALGPATQGDAAMAKPPETPPSSDIDGVNMDARAGKPAEDHRHGSSAELKTAHDESTAKPPEKP